MEKTVQPVLSIGIIFKNEIRCLERCLKSLTPLRQRISCELVMADTGSDDGSREVAEKYADILFDFPWINDFSAARNAVMDRCSGAWYFSIDADEWLDEDVKEFAWFLNQGEAENYDAAVLIERNYYTYDTKGGYGSFMPWRLLRVSTGLRFLGKIHEHWDVSGLRCFALCKTLLHHDGYVEMNGPGGKAKRERNVTLLREKLNENPDELLTRLQYIESGGAEVDFLDNLRKSVELVKRRVPAWDTLGASVMRYAITNARGQKLPEAEEWIHLAEEWFPGSYFTRIDTAFEAASYYLEAEKYEESIHWGEMCVNAYEDYRAGRGEITCQLYGSVQRTMPICEAAIKIVLARGYFGAERWDEAVAILMEADCTVLDVQWMYNMMETLHMFQHRSSLDTSPLITSVWESLNRPEPAQDWADRRRSTFMQLGSSVFTHDYLQKEHNSEDFCRHVYTLYKPIAGECVLGMAARMLDTESAEELKELLGKVENWDEFPIPALTHAIESGVEFPVSEQLMNIDELDNLAARTAQDWPNLYMMLKRVVAKDFAKNWQTLTWARALALAAVCNYNWSGKDEEQGMELARIFSKVEGIFIKKYYAADLLQEHTIYILPSMHRFGWYCSAAFEALDTGDRPGYLRFLRMGLTSCKRMKAMVEFLREHTPEIQEAIVPPPSGELLELAQKVRAMLSLYPANDPNVATIKQSPAYRRVASLIEGPALPVIGGLKQ